MKWTGSGKKEVGEEKKAAFRGNENSGLFQRRAVVSVFLVAYTKSTKGVWVYKYIDREYKDGC